jgi:tetratricopeptide (TPR) repeat protein
MEGFYKRLLRATPRGVALYRAKRDILARHPDRPDLWAGFVLQGDPAELSRYRFLMAPSGQYVSGSITKVGNVTYLDTGRRLFASFEVPVEGGEPLSIASFDVRNLSEADAKDRQADAKRAFQKGRYEEAVDALLGAFGLLDESSVAERPLAAQLHADVAIVLAYKRDLQRSLEHGLAALATYEALEDWPLKLGPVLDNIAAAEVGLGRLDEARHHYERALAVKREERPGGHPSIDFTLARLADLDEQARGDGGRA